MKRDELKFAVILSQVPQNFLARVKLGSIRVHIVLIDFISEQNQLLSRTELDHFLNVIIRQYLTCKREGVMPPFSSVTLKSQKSYLFQFCFKLFY